MVSTGNRQNARVFNPKAYTVMPEPDDRTITLHICDIETDGSGVLTLDTVHILPKKTRRRGPVSARWFQKAGTWALDRLRSRDEAEGITVRNRSGQRIKMIMDGSEFFFHPCTIAAGVRKARQEIASPQMRIF